MNNNITTIEPKKQELTWKEIFKLSIIDLSSLASQVNELTKEREQLVK